MAKVGHEPRVQQKRMFSYPAVIVNREEPDTKVGHPATSPGLSSYMFGCGP